ncbi:MAG TPA: outer membrane beta-barrel family protein, partial [Mucilaginibacter sp.]
GAYITDTTMSNRFVYRENVDRAYIIYSGTAGKFDVEAGLSAELTHSTGTSQNIGGDIKEINHYNYFNLFPNVLLTYHYNDKQDFTLSVSRGILRPAYENLNPFLYYIDPYNYQQGNSSLKPEYSNTIKLTHNYNQTIETSLYANLETNTNFTYYRQNDSSKLNLTTVLNLGRVYSYGAEVNAAFKINKWWNAQFDADASYQRYTVYKQIGTFNKSTGSLILTTTQNFAIGKVISAAIDGRYQSASLEGIRQFRDNYSVNTGISAQVLQKKGRLSFTVTDIFNTDRGRASVNYQNINLYIVDKRETRIARLSFTYRFGKTSVKAEARHSTGNEDEQSRMRKASN